MNTVNYFTAPKTLRRVHAGSLGPYVDSFASWLQAQHYSPATVQRFVRAVADWSRWLHVHGVGSNDVGAKQLDGFVRYRAQHARNGAVDQDGRRGLQKMLVWLQKTGVASQSNVPPPLSDREIIVHDFGQYLLRQRGISSRTLRGYLPYISQFLEECFGHEVIKVETLRTQDVIGFVRRNSRTLGHSSIQHRVTALRAFLRYLRHKGKISIDLAACVPSVASWSFSALPKFLLSAQVQLVLDQCDRSTSKGRRDYAIFLLLARLGLRAGEVAALTLDDIDWEQGHLTLRGKGGRWSQLPILVDVGEAMSNYITNGRPSTSDRHVFVRELAPRTGFSASTCISALVRSAVTRAGIDSARKGAHLLRHSLATEMLRRGSSLREIGEVLRHRSPDTTQLYAKVDLPSLQQLAMRWPGGEQ
jgi:site-specific recombinase XerD